MSNGFSRMDRIAEMIQRMLAKLIQQEIHDPRLQGLITLSGVKISKDLRLARIYFTVINQDPEETAIVLNAAAPQLRFLLAKSATTRTVPQLHFYYDESVAYGSRLSHLINKVNPSTPNDQSTDE